MSMISTATATFEASLSRWASETRVLDDADVAIARALVLDSVGLMASGARTPVAMLLAEADENKSSRTRSPGACIIVGTADRASPRSAALRNGTAGAAQLWDDTSLTMRTHSSVPIIAALLANENVSRMTWGEFLRAFAVGMEVELAVGGSTAAGIYQRGFHATSVLGPIGAAAALAHARGLDQTQMCNALGVSTSLASGVRIQFGADVMPLHSGFAAEHGVMAVQLAASGLNSDALWLTGRHGFAEAFAGVDNLDHVWSGPIGLAAADFVLKEQPIGAPNVAPVDAARRAREHMGDSPGQILEVRCRVHHWVSNTVKHTLPEEPSAGRVSLPYCVAAALMLQGDLSSAFIGEAPPPKNLMDIASRVVIEAVECTDAMGRPTAEVEVITDSGVYRASASADAYVMPSLEGAHGDSIRRKFASNWKDRDSTPLWDFVSGASLTTGMHGFFTILDT